MTNYDPRDPVQPGGFRNRVVREEGFGWGIPAAIIAAVIIIGGLWYANSGPNTQTATNANPPSSTGPVNRTAPAPAPVTPTAPAPKQ